jgi:hypothetical protein
VLPSRALAHNAFGDIGPFYQALLHPLADPSQGLLLAAAAVLLARQPLTILRPAYAALVAGAVAAATLAAVVDLPAPPARAPTLATLALALAALAPVRTWRIAAGAPTAAAAAAGALAALVPGAGAGLPAVIGTAAGVAFVPLLLWVAVDWADRRVSPLASRVLSAWIAAVALMVTALPA